jgi:hypothetical protein
MKKIISIILFCLIISTIYVGCGKQMEENEKTSQTAAIGNPWSDWDSIEEAESVIGFLFGLPEVIAESYNAVKQIISYNGYSWSLVAPNGCRGDYNRDFGSKIWEQ